MFVKEDSREDLARRTRDRVAEFLAAGHTVSEIARRVGVSKPTVCCHARRLGHTGSAKYKRRYDWSEVQRYYDAGHTVRECREHFGFANETWNNAVRRGDVIPRPRGLPLDEVFVSDRTETSRYSLKRRLLKAARCEECGLTDWCGRPLSPALHHVNGDPKDSRLENLRMVCAAVGH